MSFRFRLDAVERHWEREERKRQALVAQCDRHLAEKREEQARWQAHLVALDREYCRLAAASTLTAPELNDYLVLQRQVRNRLQELGRQISALEAERARRDASRLEAARQRRRMEIARERALAAWTASEQARETALMDELAVLGRARPGQAPQRWQAPP